MSEGTTKVETIREGWNLWSWSRELPAEADPVAPSRRRELSAKIADAPDDQRVMLTAGELRSLLAAADRPKERGARIEGEGVIYYATIDRDRGRHLRTLEIEAQGDRPDPKAFRVPVRLVEDLTRYVLATQEEIADGDDPADVVVFETGVSPEGQHSPELLRDLIGQGVPPSGIAKMLNLKERRVFQLLQQARIERPELNWPPARRGPRPRKTIDGK
jgi:hypothetical protein